MIRRSPKKRQRGQAIVELSLLMPVIFGLVALTLQGGVVISDQVNLQHYAYEAGQWAVNNRATATTGASGTVATHIKDQLCGNGSTYATANAVTRYCRSGNLVVDVTAVETTAMNRAPSDGLLGPFVMDAMAATCQGWDLSVSPASTQAAPINIAEGSSQNLTTALTGPGGSGSPSGSGSVPLVTLTASGDYPNQNSGTPFFNPPTITTGGSSTYLEWPSKTAHTGLYHLQFSGTDQCGQGPAPQPARDVWINVTPGGGGPVTIGTGLNLHLDGLLPICLPIGGGTFVVNGVNFAAGAQVTVGSGSSSVSASSVVVVNSGQLSVTLPPMPAGLKDLTVTNTDGSSTTIANALTIGSCAGAPPPPGSSGSSVTCASALESGATEFRITITWTETLVVPWISNNLALTARQRAFCQ